VSRSSAVDLFVEAVEAGDRSFGPYLHYSIDQRLQT